MKRTRDFNISSFSARRLMTACAIATPFYYSAPLHAENIPQAEQAQPADKTVHVPVVTQTSEMENTVFDLFMGDEFKGSVVTSYSETQCEIEEPQDAATQLESAPGSSEKLLQLFTGPFTRERTIAGIGTVRCDPLTFRVVVNPDKSLLQSTSLDLGQRVGQPESGFSVHQTMGVAAFTESGADNSSAFTHRGVMSYGDVFFRSNGFLSQQQPYQLNEATLGTIIDDYQARAGFLQMRAQSFSPSLRFAGLQFETAEDLFLDNDSARGSKLEVFIPSRSTVQFYRESQLISVQVLDFGLQEVDTSSFPQGSYDVDIIIIDSAGRETRDRRFYTKVGFLASRAKPVFYFSGGAVRETLDILGTPLGQAGMRIRASDYFDFGASVAATNQNSLLSSAINGYYSNIRMGVNGAVTPDGDYGGFASLGFMLLGFSLNGQSSYAQGQDRAPGQPQPDPNLPNYVPQIPNTPTELYIQTLRSTSYSVSRHVGPVDFRYNIQRNRVGDGENRYTKGFSTDWRIFTGNENQSSLRLADLSTETGRNRSIQLFYRHKFSPAWSLDTQLMRRRQQDQDENLFVAGVQYVSQVLQSSTGSRAQLVEELRSLKNQGVKQDSATTSMQSILTGDYVQASSFFRDVRTAGGENQTNLGVNAESTFLVTNKGEFEVTFPPQAESVFVAEVAGNRLGDDDTFTVTVDGQPQGIVARNERGIISLAPYRKYTIGIAAQPGSGLVDYDAATYEVTLFPGNVTKRVWSIDKVFVLIGRLLDEEGNPIARERIRGAKGYAFTEEDGTFQIEITGTEQLSVDSKRRKCSLDLKMPETLPEYYLDAQDVRCISSESGENQ